MKNLADLKRLIRLALSAPLVLRVIGIIAAVDLIIILFAVTFLEDDVGERAQRVSGLRDQLTSIDKNVQTTRAQIDGLPELRKEYDRGVKADLLVAQDRAKFVDLAKDLANKHSLSDLHFRLAVETQQPLPASKLQLVSTDVELTNGGVLDSDVLSFWNEFLVKSQAHYQVTKATLEVGTISPAAASQMILGGQQPVMVKADLVFRWQSLRQAGAGGAKAEGNGARPFIAPGTGGQPR